MIVIVNAVTLLSYYVSSSPFPPPYRGAARSASEPVAGAARRRCTVVRDFPEACPQARIQLRGQVLPDDL